jgi:hypothetical protein
VGGPADGSRAGLEPGDLVEAHVFLRATGGTRDRPGPSDPSGPPAIASPRRRRAAGRAISRGRRRRRPVGLPGRAPPRPAARVRAAGRPLHELAVPGLRCEPPTGSGDRQCEARPGADEVRRWQCPLGTGPAGRASFTLLQPTESPEHLPEFFDAHHRAGLVDHPMAVGAHDRQVVEIGTQWRVDLGER